MCVCASCGKEISEDDEYYCDGRCFHLTEDCIPDEVKEMVAIDR